MAKAKKQQAVAVVASGVSQTEKNRQARIARHLRKHPEDKQAAKAATHAGTLRKSPKTKGNFPKQKHPIRDCSGAVTGYAEYRTFTFAGQEMVPNEKGNMVINPLVKEAWNEYKSTLANAARQNRNSSGRGGRKVL